MVEAGAPPPPGWYKAHLLPTWPGRRQAWCWVPLLPSKGEEEEGSMTASAAAAGAGSGMGTGTAPTNDGRFPRRSTGGMALRVREEEEEEGARRTATTTDGGRTGGGRMGFGGVVRLSPGTGTFGGRGAGALTASRGMAGGIGGGETRGGESEGPIVTMTSGAGEEEDGTGGTTVAMPRKHRPSRFCCRPRA